MLRGFIIGPRDFSVGKELIVMSGFITTQFCHFCENCVRPNVPAFNTFVSAFSFEIGNERKPKEERGPHFLKNASFP